MSICGGNKMRFWRQGGCHGKTKVGIAGKRLTNPAA
jgi:hypothetical protein